MLISCFIQGKVIPFYLIIISIQHSSSQFAAFAPIVIVCNMAAWGWTVQLLRTSLRHCGIIVNYAFRNYSKLTISHSEKSDINGVPYVLA